MSTVLLTGASGFIALHVTDLLLKKGYTVIGTVRSRSKADKLIKQFNEIHPNAKLSYELVADVSKDGSFDEIFTNHPEITSVLHTASPFSFGLDKPLDEGYLIPAVNGTKNVLVSIKKLAPQVKTVVVTSSFASIVDSTRAADRSFFHTEETWNPIEWSDVTEEIGAYFASKKLAEKAAWDFLENEKPNFKLTTVNPPYVFGTQFFDDALENPTLNTSADYVNQALNTPADDVEFHSQPYGLAVSVKDVALLHTLPLEDEKLAGKRLFPSGGPFIGQSILNTIHKHFPELDGKVGKGKPEGTKEYEDKYMPQADTSKTLELVGLKEWTSLEQTIVEATKQILDYRKAKSSN